MAKNGVLSRTCVRCGKEVESRLVFERKQSVRGKQDSNSCVETAMRERRRTRLTSIADPPLDVAATARNTKRQSPDQKVCMDASSSGPTLASLQIRMQSLWDLSEGNLAVFKARPVSGCARLSHL
jgi:hypothetical protein